MELNLLVLTFTHLIKTINEYFVLSAAMTLVPCFLHVPHLYQHNNNSGETSSRCKNRAGTHPVLSHTDSSSTVAHSYAD